MPRETSAFVMFVRLAILIPLITIQTLPLTARATETGAAEDYAADGGRTLGAANACGFDPEEILIAMKQVMDAARQRAINPAEREAIQPRFVEGLRSGVKAVRSSQATCIDTRDDLTKIEDEAYRK